ncbi:MAG TPA: hypothetical protein VIN59_07080 [Alphaproteobacteria bacterium]
MTFVRSLMILGLFVVISAPAQAEPCPGFTSAMSEVEAALPPVQAPVVLTPPHG